MIDVVMSREKDGGPLCLPASQRARQTVSVSCPGPSSGQSIQFPWSVTAATGLRVCYECLLIAA